MKSPNNPTLTSFGKTDWWVRRDRRAISTLFKRQDVMSSSSDQIRRSWTASSSLSLPRAERPGDTAATT